MAIITPRRQSPDLTQALNMLGTGVERYMSRIDKNKADERQAAIDAENAKIRALQTEQLQQGVDTQKKISGLRDEAVSVIGQPDEPFEGGLGPITMEKSGQIMKSKEARLKEIAEKRKVYQDKDLGFSGKAGVTVGTDAEGNWVRIPQEMGAEAELVTIGGKRVKKGYKPDKPIKGVDTYWEKDPKTGEYTDLGIKTPDAVKNMISMARLNIDRRDLEIKENQLNRGLTQDKAREEFSLENSISNLDRLADAAKKIADNENLWRITGWAGLIPSIPGGKGADLEAELGTLESQIAFTVLQNMRDASKTGGALGQVSEREIDFLKNNLATLKTSQSPEAFEKNLRKIIEFVDGSKKRISEAYSKGWGQVQTNTTNNQIVDDNDPMGLFK